MNNYQVLTQVTLLVTQTVEADSAEEAERLVQEDPDLDEVLEILDSTTLSVDLVDP